MFFYLLIAGSITLGRRNRMFKFTEEDLASYIGRDPKWGQVGVVTYKRTYSRPILNVLTNEIIAREDYLDTCVRVVEGSMNLVPNDPTATRQWALDALEMMYHMGIMPPGRGYWMMGTEYSAKRGGDALNNCWYIGVRPQSYEDMDQYKNTYYFSKPNDPMPSFPFVFMFDRAMLGGGVGFGIGKKNLKKYRNLTNKVNLKIILRADHPDWDRIRTSEEWVQLGLEDIIIPGYTHSEVSYDPTTDDREGWGVAVRELIDAHWSAAIWGNSSRDANMAFNFSNIREYGADISGFGGTASGPLPLIAAMVTMNTILNQRVGKNLRPCDALDIMNILGRCVVAGNVRRTALIALGDPDDKEYIDAKNYTLVSPIIDTTFGEYGWYTNQWGRKTQKLKDRDVCVAELAEKHYDRIRTNDDHLSTNSILELAQEQAEEEVDHMFDVFWKQNNHRWASNNSVMTTELFTDFHFIAAGIVANGEPGIVNEWLTQNFGRIKDGYQEAIDGDAEGTNPCGEVSLENAEPCNVVEFVPYRCKMFGFDFHRAIEIVTQYAFRITFAKYMWKATARVIEKNRRIGVSLTGMQDYYLDEYGHYACIGFEDGDITKPIFDKRITDELDTWYGWVVDTNEKHAALMGVKPSKKKTTGKPSGTVAKMPGVSSGIHWHYSAFLIQRIRFADNDPNLEVFKMCGLPIEKAAKEPNTVVVQFPVKNPNADHPNFLSSGQVPLEVQFANQFLFCNYWADNAISATLSFQQDEIWKIEPLLKAYSTRIKSTSLLPYSGHGYVQPPWEPIDEEHYNRLISAMVDTPENIYKYMKVAGLDGMSESDCLSGACPSK